ncbi:MAG: hypothetical protein P4N59_29000 [Negativicutes bacterium]|nr:hypothetical protein [Negativicutes bacterium]
MKRRMICLLVVSMFILSNTAFATNWVLVKSTDSLGWKMYEYIDADTVVQKDSTLIFWYVFKLVKPLGASQKVYKVEESVANHQYRVLELYFFVNGKPTKQDLTSSKYVDDTNMKDKIDMALKYAKEGNEIGSVPPPP